MTLKYETTKISTGLVDPKQIKINQQKARKNTEKEKNAIEDVTTREDNKGGCDAIEMMVQSYLMDRNKKYFEMRQN